MNIIPFEFCHMTGLCLSVFLFFALTGFDSGVESDAEDLVDSTSDSLVLSCLGVGDLDLDLVQDLHPSGDFFFLL